jgi:hypothetical protein
MSIQLDVRRNEPVEDSSFRAVLKSMEKKQTTFGERILWIFRVPEHNAEVAWFTSLSESTRANAYLWATALNAEIRSKVSRGPEDVVGRECILDLTIVEDSKGRSFAEGASRRRASSRTGPTEGGKVLISNIWCGRA